MVWWLTRGLRGCYDKLMSVPCMGNEVCMNNNQDNKYIPFCYDWLQVWCVAVGYASRLSDVASLVLLCSMLGRVNGQLE